MSGYGHLRGGVGPTGRGRGWASRSPCCAGRFNGRRGERARTPEAKPGEPGQTAFLLAAALNQP